MAYAELGSGLSGLESINVIGVEICPNSCPFRYHGDGRFSCPSPNHNPTILVSGGITRDTVEEFTSMAPCFKDSN